MPAEIEEAHDSLTAEKMHKYKCESINSPIEMFNKPPIDLQFDSKHLRKSANRSINTESLLPRSSIAQASEKIWHNTCHTGKVGG